MPGVRSATDCVARCVQQRRRGRPGNEGRGGRREARCVAVDFDAANSTCWLHSPATGCVADSRLLPLASSTHYRVRRHVCHNLSQSLFIPHRSHCRDVAWSVCMSVCPLRTTRMYCEPCNTAELIEMPFGVQIRVQGTMQGTMKLYVRQQRRALITITVASCLWKSFLSVNDLLLL